MSLNSWQLINLSLSDYRPVLSLQEKILKDVINGRCRNTLILVEHTPVFTLGNRFNALNLKVDKRFLAARNIDLIQTRRGGDITYHGPGQIVAYPILSLKENQLSVPEYINLLEEVMLLSASAFGVRAKRSEENRGIWCGAKKLGSVGIGLKRWVSYHGLALNVNMDLTPYSWINPCGLKNTSVTSIAEESGTDVTVEEVTNILTQSFQTTFDATMQPLQLGDTKYCDCSNNQPINKETSLA